MDRRECGNSGLDNYIPSTSGKATQQKAVWITPFLFAVYFMNMFFFCSLCTFDEFLLDDFPVILVDSNAMQM